MRRRGRLIAGVLAGALGVVAMLAGALAPAAASGGAADRPVDRTIDHYVLFALHHLKPKGGKLAGRGLVTGGDVGVNEAGLWEGGPRLTPCSNAVLKMDDGTQLNGDTVEFTDSCDVYDVYGNDISGNPPGAARNSGPTAVSMPLIAAQDIPQIPAFNCDANADVDVANGQTMSLPPGTYGSLSVHDTATLNLGAGTYAFCDITQSPDSSITTQPTTIVRIVDTFEAGNSAQIGSSCDTQWWVRADHPIGSNNQGATFGHDSTVYGMWWNLNAQTNLGNNNEDHGQFLGDDVVADFNTNVYGCGSTFVATTTTTVAPTTTVPSGTTTTVLSGTTTTTSAPVTTTTVASGTTTTSPAPTTTTSAATTSTTAAPTTTTTVAPTTTTTAAPATSTSAATTTTVPAGTTTTSVGVSPTTAQQVAPSSIQQVSTTMALPDARRGALPFTGSGSGFLELAGAVLAVLGGLLCASACRKRPV